jgi:hypothetical protein
MAGSLTASANWWTSMGRAREVQAVCHGHEVLVPGRQISGACEAMTASSMKQDSTLMMPSLPSEPLQFGDASDL